ncbi:hypothetical protein GCM10009599_05670 [Luteococcus peritonei]
MLAGLALTAAVTLAVAGPSVVYFSRTTVNILEPDGGKVRILGYHSPDSIAVANILAARVNEGVHTPLASNPDVTLYAIGIHQGTHAQVRNVGGQWLSSVTEPVVDVQVVDPSREAVAANMRREVARVGAELTELENQLKVPKAERIELELNPKDPVIEQVVTPHARAMAGYGLFGLGLTLVATYWFDRYMNGRAARRASHPHSEEITA